MLAQNIDELRFEIDTLADIIQKAEKVVGSETKLRQLKETLQDLDRSYPNEKILVFTESLDTLDYLVNNIRSWGYTVNTIHGSMNGDERKQAETVFRDTTRVMVATEAAGEGINLQFCHLMINYDLPWNPNRLEQRMGRIHRYGQRLPVFIFNLVAADTREGEILVRLFEKLDSIKAIMGNDKIFDVISDIVPGKSLSQMMLDATVRSKQQKQILSELDGIVGDSSAIKNQMKDSFTTKQMNVTALRGIGELINEKSLAPEYSKYLFCNIIRAAGGQVQDEGQTAQITVPPPISGGKFLASFEKGVHDKMPDTEFITFGHPVFEAALQWARTKFSADIMNKTTVRDPTGRLDGYLVFYTGNVHHGAGKSISSHMVACLINPKTDTIKSVSPSVLLDLDWSEDVSSADNVDIDYLQKAASPLVGQELKSHVSNMAQYGRIQADMAQKYGLKSMDFLLDSIEGDILRLLDRKRRGNKVDLAIYNKREDRNKYRMARKNLQQRIESDLDLRIEEISLIGAIHVIPVPSKTSRQSAHDAGIEFEMQHDRMPESVSGQGYGFDMRSYTNPPISSASASGTPSRI